MACPTITRRNLIRYTALGGVALPVLTGLSLPQEAEAVVQQEIFRFPEDEQGLTDLQLMHRPKVTLPPVVEDGGQAPIVVEMDHPMDPDHYIQSIQILSFRDPVVIKGKFYFTPASGVVYLGTQIRLDGGDNTVWVVAECNQHGRFALSKTVKVAAGGC